jgi:hypothetical protein
MKTSGVCSSLILSFFAHQSFPSEARSCKVGFPSLNQSANAKFASFCLSALF